MSDTSPATDRENLGGSAVAFSRRVMLSSSAAAWLVARPMAARGAAPERTTIDLLELIPESEREKIAAGTSSYDCTPVIQSGINKARENNGALHVRSGTYLVSTITITGSNYEITTDAAVTFRQLLDSSGSRGRPVVEIIEADNINIGDLTIEGNISRNDGGEDNHAVLVAKSSNISIGNLYGRNIRGDVLYCYGRDTSWRERLDDLKVGRVSGANIFRNLVSVIGGCVSISELINDGPVGYRDLDIEPNAEGRYQRADVSIGRAVIGSLEVTSDDPATTSLSFKIRELDADGNRIHPSTPPYPRAPGKNGYALGIAYVERVSIIRAKVRNYASYAINLGERHGEIRIGSLEIANCGAGERTFNAAIAKRGSTAEGSLIVENVQCYHPDNTKWLIHSDRRGMRVSIGGGTIMGGLLAVNCIVDVRRLSIDAGGADGPGANILVRAGGSRLTSVSVKGAAGATLLYDCPGCSLIAVSGYVARISTDAGTKLFDSTITSPRATLSRRHSA